MPKRDDVASASGEPQPKRAKREDRKAKLEEYKKAKIEKEKERKRTERPVWRPAGVNTRSMARSQSDSALAKPISMNPRKEKALKKTKSHFNLKKTAVPEKENTKTSTRVSSPIREEDDSITKDATTNELNKLPLPKFQATTLINTDIPSELLKSHMHISQNHTSTPLHPANIQTTGITPKFNKISIGVVDPVKDESSKFPDPIIDTSKWLVVYKESVSKLEQCKKEIEGWITENLNEFWKSNIDTVHGEVFLYLGPKSKHSQFGKMCDDPTNQKFKVEKDEDLEAFWDGMVLPSVKHFHAKMEWLKKAAENQWPESLQSQEPISEIGKSPARPRQNKNVKPKTAEEIEAADKKKKDAADKRAQIKKDAENRRKEMRKKMMAQKKKMKEVSQESGGVAEVLTEKSTNIEECVQVPINN